MPGNLSEQKAALRSRARAALDNTSPAARARASAQARLLLAQQMTWKQAKSILFFAPLPDELDVWPLLSEALAAGKTVALPRFLPATRTYGAARIHDLQSDIRTGRFGIREPVESCADVPLNRLDLVLVPGVAFDGHGRRLGRGKGFYDRLLSAVRGIKWGVAFDEQIVGDVPAGPHDIYLNCIVTPTRRLEVAM